MKKERYIIAGAVFPTYEKAEDWAKQNNWRITNTETIKPGVFLLTVSSI